MTELLPNIYAIEVPKDARDLFIQENFLCFWTKTSLHYLDRYFGAPGNYSFLFCSFNCTEEQAASVVWKEGHFAYWNYIDGVPSCETSLMSLNTLLYSKQLDPSKNYALIKKIEP